MTDGPADQGSSAGPARPAQPRRLCARDRPATAPRRPRPVPRLPDRARRGPRTGRRAARRRRGPAQRRHPLRRAAQRAEGPGQGGRQGLRRGQGGAAGPREGPGRGGEGRRRPAREATARADALVLAISNLVHPDSPRGGEEDFTVLEQRGTIRDFAGEGITVRDHLEIGEALRAIDVERGAKVSGVALLLPHRRRRAARARPDQPRDGPGDRQRAHPDHPAGAGQARGHGGHRVPRPGRRERLPPRGRRHVPRRAPRRSRSRPTTPTRSSPPTPCRAGSPATPPASAARPAPTARTPAASSASTGSTRWRCSPSPRPEDAEAEHARLLEFEKQFLDSLELPYRVIDVATGDLGASATRKFDCEAWIPSQGRYRELTSTSNCTTFQARRLRVRERGRRRHRPPAGHAQRDAGGDPAHDHRDPGEPPAGRRLRARARGAAAVPRRPARTLEPPA